MEKSREWGKKFFHSLLDVMKGTWYFFILNTKGIAIFFCRWKFLQKKSMELATVEKGTIEIQLFSIKALLTDFRNKKKSFRVDVVRSYKRKLLFYVQWTFTFCSFQIRNVLNTCNGIVL